MKIISKIALILAAVVTLSACERPPITTVQTGYRGTGMEQIYNPRTLAKEAALNQAPVPAPAASPTALKLVRSTKTFRYWVTSVWGNLSDI